MSNDPRYTIFAARAVFDTRLTAMDVRVLAALGTFSDRQGWCRPSQTTIAKRIGSNRTWVNASIKRLVDAGYVQSVKQTNDTRAQTVNLYRVLMDLSAPEAAVETLSTGEILEFLPVSHSDTPLSGIQTGLHAAPAEAVSAQHVDPLSVPTDTPLSVPTDTPCLLQQTQNIPIEHSQRNKRASRLPATWAPRAEEVAFGKEGGLSDAEVLAAADHMRDWAASSPKASKLDWDRTFRNWLRTTISDAKRGRRPVVSRSATDPAEIDRRHRLFEFDGTWSPDWGPKPSTTRSQA